CVMCGIEEWKKKMSANYMEDNLFYKIADEIIENKEKVVKVAMFVGNEPLLDKQLAKRIGYFKKHNIKVNFSTNGSLMDAKRSVEILESGVDHINFSVDGLDKQVYERMRKPLKFEDILGNVLQFIKIRDAMDAKSAIRISIIKNSHLMNEGDIKRVCNFWYKFLNTQKGDSIRIDELIPMHAAEGNNLEDLLYDEESLFAAANKTPCYILWNTLTIKCDGSIALCNVDQCRNWRGGNLRESSISRLWSAKSKDSIKHKHLTFGRGSVSMCKNCLSWL
ncbi:MAG: radical SAM protein, partial [Helicobacter sp.]|nr:radical SAM protein [Helicobacter sp.]